MSEEPKKTAMEDFLSQLENELKKRYLYYYEMEKNRFCNVKKCSIASLEFDAFYYDLSCLKEAIHQIRMDIEILYYRRGKLITESRMSEGKIAGIITYRLAKAHINNVCKQCVNCGKGKCFSHIGIIFAIRFGLDYIHRKFPDLHEGIRKELIYNIKHRHVNQETLGLVFDTLVEYIPEV